MPWHASHDSSVRFWEALGSHSDVNAVAQAAQRLAHGRFTALGISITEPDGRFNWHRDYGSGVVWPLERFDRIDYMGHPGADVKSVWELSRMYWIGTLGIASRGNNGSTSTETFRRLINEWSGANPYPYGVNWAMPMDVGIRAFWLVAGHALFGHDASPASYKEKDWTHLFEWWWRHYDKQIYRHGEYLSHTLEYFPNLTNHYIADLLGLLVVGALFAEDEKGHRWFEDAHHRLEKELRRQVHPDGVHYELSLCYHGLVLEMILIALLVAERAGRPFSEEARRIVGRMLRFTAAYTPPGGAMIPQLGDSDDGRILRLHADDSLYDHRFLLDIGARMDLIDVNERGHADPSLQELLLFGPQNDDLLRRSVDEATTIAQTSLRLFPHGGFAAMRTDRLFVVADIGAIGLHGNNDTLGFTLHTADGAPWIVDPGTGCYTRDHALRNALRSTAAHNAPMIDGREIAEFAGLWRVVEDRTGTRIIESDEKRVGEDIEITLSAEHHAYDDARGGGIVVERAWRVRGGSLEVRDRIQGVGEHHARIAFTLDPGVRIERIDATTVMLRRDDSDLAIELIASLPLTIDETIYSPGYGIIQATQCIVVATSIKAPSEMTYLWRLHGSERTISPDERESRSADDAARAIFNE